MQKEWRTILKITNEGPIAFFDSGVGGLTVYAKLKELLPNEKYIYFGDTKHMPYGEKTKNELLEYAGNILDFFIKQNAKAVIMACNTTSSTIYDDIKNKYDLKIYPIVQSVADILSNLPINKLGILATHATVKSNAYKKEIQKHNPAIEVIQIACPEWVKIVEENKLDQPQSIILVKEKLDEILKYNPEKIVLGCTHYPFLIDIIKKFVPEEMLIDPAIYFAKYIKEDLQKNNLIKNNRRYEQIYVSSNPEIFRKSAQRFYQIKNSPELVVFN